MRNIEPEQDIGSHCKYITYTIQHECMGLRAQSTVLLKYTHMHNTGTDSRG